MRITNWACPSFESQNIILRSREQLAIHFPHTLCAMPSTSSSCPKRLNLQNGPRISNCRSGAPTALERSGYNKLDSLVSDHHGDHNRSTKLSLTTDFPRPLRFQHFKDLSRLPLNKDLPSMEKVTQYTASAWPHSRPTSSPVSTFQSRITLSKQPAASNSSVGQSATDMTLASTPSGAVSSILNRRF